MHISQSNNHSQTATSYKQLLIDNHIKLFKNLLGWKSEQIERLIESKLQRERGKAVFKILCERYNLSDCTLLDVGSGWGEVLAEGALKGIHCTGIEPDEEERIVSIMLRKELDLEYEVKEGFGEKLPFGDNSFDFITCIQVLEHVKSISGTLSELKRVIKPDGIIMISVPNYLFPYEGHYRIKWISLLPKPIGRFYLKIIGRDTYYFDNFINYTTLFNMLNQFRKHKLRIVENVTESRLKNELDSQCNQINKIKQKVLLTLKLYPNITWLLKK